MNTKDVCSLYELTDAQGSGHPGVYVLGSFCTGERVAVSSQQTRALNLIHALFAEKRLDSSSRICVIGGGAAGLTAAAFAISRDAVVTVLESHDLLWNLRGCRTRWLHPNLFRWWPNPQWKCTGTDFPVMNWYAGYANEVGELLHLKYLSFEAMQDSRASRTRLSFPGHQLARGIKVDAAGTAWNVTWRPLNDFSTWDPSRCDVFDVVIVATGFGSEARTRDAEASLYWLDDTLERERPSGRQMRYLISGTGDGGLTDLLRVRVKSFRHHHLRDCLLDLDMYAAELEADIEEIERQAREQAGFDITEAYKRLASRRALGGLMSGRREGTSVVLTNKESGGALVSPAWRVSKFLAAQLLKDDPYTQYRKGPAQWRPLCSAPVDPIQPAPHPDKFHATFAPGQPADDFDAVVVRHGPPPLIHPQWGIEKIRAVDFTLIDLGFKRANIEAASLKWREQATLRQVTDETIDPSMMRPNRETRLRSRAHTVLPAMGGRTVIGMLSRLMSSVGPEEHDAPRHKGVIIKDLLVADDVAALLTQVAYRLPRGARAADASSGTAEPADVGWRLGAELNRKEAIEVIWAADYYLFELWQTHPHTAEMLELNWVLPRAPWVARAPLLEFTCVARHWGQWHLRYLRDTTTLANPALKTKAARRRHLLAAIKTVPPVQSEPDHPQLTIVDYCAMQYRIGIVSSSAPKAWRLANELQVEYLYVEEDNELHELQLVTSKPLVIIDDS